jgi:hypothetical protein
VVGAVPRECEATIFEAIPVDFENKLFLGKDVNQVLDIGFVGILDAKVVDHKGEFDDMGRVLPETGGDGTGSIALCLQELGKLFVGNDADPGKAVHAFLNVDVHMSILD